MEYPKFKVCVRCFTYNQSKYITDALNGFCMQETNFPFVCCVVDDASTDGEQEVINKYVEQHFNLEDTAVAYKKETDYAYITYAQHKTNKNCYFAVLLLKRNYYSTGEGEKKMEYISEWLDNVEYEALCEGDDWWLSEHKLQKQYDILESHPEVDMCACGAIDYKDGKQINKQCPSETERILSVNEVILGGGGYVMTASLMFRESINHYGYQFRRQFLIDYFLQILGSLRGGMYFLPECMAAYRREADNSWTMRMIKNTFENMLFISKVVETLGVLDKETNLIYHEPITIKQLDYFRSLSIFGIHSSLVLKKMKFRTKLSLIKSLLKSLLF